MTIGRTGPPGTVRRARPSVDLATFFGVTGAFALIAVAIVLGGSPSAFVDVPAICIVIGGTLGITTACFSLSEVAVAQKLVLKVLVNNQRDPAATARRILQLAQHARSKGILALQPYLPGFERERFLHKGLTMAIDGVKPDEIESHLCREAGATASRHRRSAAVLRKAGEVSPAMGLIGTLVGLVQMLGNLEDPSSIGPAMAVALLTTFYGAVLAHMVFNPLATKLERRSQHEQLVHTLDVMGVTSIARQENPRRLETMFNTVLSPIERVRFFD